MVIILMIIKHLFIKMHLLVLIDKLLIEQQMDKIKLILKGLLKIHILYMILMVIINYLDLDMM